LVELKAALANMAKNDPEGFKAKDQVKGKFFSEPGVFEVTAKGIQDVPKKAGGTWQALVLEDDTGRVANVPVFLLDKDKNPAPIKMQMMLKGFGIMFSQKQIAGVWDFLLAQLPQLLVGRVSAQLSYYGFVPWYEEKGLYSIRDFGKGAKPYPDNQLVDPMNNDVYAAESKEGIQAIMAELKMKEGGNNWSILRPAPGFEMTEIQADLVQTLEALNNDAPLPEATKVEAEPEKPKPAKPSFMLKK
jgi:hypothetical protein